MIRMMNFGGLLGMLLGSTAAMGMTISSLQPQGITIRVVGKVSEKSAFELQAVFVQNSGAKLTNYDYHDYKVILAQIPNVAPADVEIVKANLRSLIAANKIAMKPFDFYFFGAEVEGSQVLIVGEHTTSPAYNLSQEMEESLQTLKTSSQTPYSISYNYQGVDLPSIIVGDVVGVKPHQVTYLINKRIEQDDLIYDNSAFSVQIDSILVE